MEKPYDCPASVPCDAERKQRDGSVLRSWRIRWSCGPVIWLVSEAAGRSDESLNPGPGPSSAPECVNETEEDLLSEMF